MNFGLRLDEIFYQHSRKVAESAVDDWVKHEALTEFTKVDMTNHYTEAKQALTSLIKELVAEAKPELPALFAGLNDIGVIMYKKGTDEFEQNILKALESK